MGNRQFKIAVQVDQDACKAGEIVKGKVYLYIPRGTKVQSFRGIHLLLHGSEQTVVAAKPGTLDYDQRKRNNRPLVEKSTTTIVRADYPLVDLSGLRAGQYEYPFQLPLRDDLPGTLFCNLGGGDKSFCQIKYSLTAYIDHSGTKTLSESQLRHELAIKVKGAPTGSPGPEPVSIESQIYPVTSCWLWKQGNISMGWRADRSVASPGDNIHIHCWGENQSRLKIEYLSFKWIESISWKTEVGNSTSTPDEGSTRKTTRVLSEERVSVQGNSDWDSKKVPRPINQDRLLRYHGSPAVVSTINIPWDARDTYFGQLVDIKHSLVVCAHTSGGWSSTSPESSTAVRITQKGLENVAMSPSTAATSEPVEVQAHVVGPSAPSSVYDDNGQVMVEAQALPDDWQPVEAEVVTLPMASAVVISDSVDVTPPQTPLASAPDESLLGSSVAPPTKKPDSANSLYSTSSIATSASATDNELQQLAQLAAECPENLPLVLEDPAWLARVRNLTPPQVSQFSQLAGPMGTRALAIQMGPAFQCKHVLACLWAFSESNRMLLLREVAPLASDLAAKYGMIEDELSSDELAAFRCALAI